MESIGVYLLQIAIILIVSWGVIQLCKKKFNINPPRAIKGLIPIVGSIIYTTFTQSLEEANILGLLAQGTQHGAIASTLYEVLVRNFKAQLDGVGVKMLGDAKAKLSKTNKKKNN